MSIVLTLKNPDTEEVYDFSPLFPTVSKEISSERDDAQGPAEVLRISMTVSGFFPSENGNIEELVQKFLKLQRFLENGNLLLTYKVGDQTHAEDVLVYVSGLSKPGDWDTWELNYSFNLYYYQQAIDHFGENGLNILCTYVHTGGTYEFETTPRWGRKISPNRSHYRAELSGSSATVTLRGKLYAENHASLMAKINELQDAFRRDGTLNYGVVSLSVRAVDVDIAPAFMRNFASYTINLGYDIGTVVELSAKTSYSRIHSNPLIKEKPLCNKREVTLRNTSGQTVTWNFRIAAQSIGTARTLLATELANRIFPGGVEMPGGEEVWDEDNKSVSVRIVKFYDEPVLSNLSGT